MARPTKRTPELVSKLEYAFSIGATVTEACLYANISRDTYYDWCKKDKELSDRMSELQDHTIFVARETLYKGIKRDPKLALEFLSKKKKDEFGSSAQEINIHLPQPILGGESRKVIEAEVIDAVHSDDSDEETA